MAMVRSLNIIFLIACMIPFCSVAYEKVRVHKLVSHPNGSIQPYIITHYPNVYWDMHVFHNTATGKYWGYYMRFSMLCGKRICWGGACGVQNPLTTKNAKHFWKVCARDFRERPGGLLYYY